MISFAFLLCSSLLLSSAIAGPVPEEPQGPEVSPPEVTEAPEQSNEVTKAAAVAAIEVVNDLMDGKDLKKSVVQRSIDALAKITGPVASAGHSFMKRVKELLDGVPISEVVGNTYNAIANKFAGKNKIIDDVTKEVGKENMQKFVQGIAKVIEDNVRQSLEKRKQKKEAEKKVIE